MPGRRAGASDLLAGRPQHARRPSAPSAARGARSDGPTALHRPDIARADPIRVCAQDAPGLVDMLESAGGGRDDSKEVTRGGVLIDRSEHEPMAGQQRAQSARGGVAIGD